jgi:hypothetical protein
LQKPFAANLFPVFFTLKRLAAKFVKPWRLAVGLALDGWRLVGTCSMFGLVWFGLVWFGLAGDDGWRMIRGGCSPLPLFKGEAGWGSGFGFNSLNHAIF